MKKVLILTNLFLLCVVWVQYHNNDCLKYQVGMEKRQTHMMHDKYINLKIHGND